MDYKFFGTDGTAKTSNSANPVYKEDFSDDYEVRLNKINKWIMAFETKPNTGCYYTFIKNDELFPKI